MTKKVEINLDEFTTRLWLELSECQYILQCLNDIFSKENEIYTSRSKGFLSYTFRIYIEFLTLKVLKLFDPCKSAGKENFTIRRIKEIVPEIELEIPKSLDALKFYRHQYLAHNDFEKTMSDFDDLSNHRNVLKETDIILKYAQEIYSKIREEHYDTSVDHRFHETSIRAFVGVLKRAEFLEYKFIKCHDKNLRKEYEEWLSKK